LIKVDLNTAALVENRSLNICLILQVYSVPTVALNIKRLDLFTRSLVLGYASEFKNEIFIALAQRSLHTTKFTGLEWSPGILLY
jgi:hypothetical protein